MPWEPFENTNKATSGTRGQGLPIGLAILLCLTMSAAGCNKSSDGKNNLPIQGDSDDSTNTSSDIKLGLSFPPVTNEYERGFTIDALTDLKLKHIRIAESWHFRETIQGEFNWSSLDERIAWAEANNIALLLTIQSQGPEWACDLESRNDQGCVYTDVSAFTHYVTSMAQRYANKIAKIQFGNEWLTDFWFPGTAAQFSEYSQIVYRAFREHSPETKFVIGGLSSESLSILSFCNNALDSFHETNGTLIESSKREAFCSSYNEGFIRFETVIKSVDFDYIDLHLYDDAENWPIYLTSIKSAIEGEHNVIVSEFGGPNLAWEAPYTDEYQASRLKTYLTTLAAMPVDEAYYFKLVQGDAAHTNHQESGLFRLENEIPIKKPSYDVLKEFLSGLDTVAAK